MAALIRAGAALLGALALGCASGSLVSTEVIPGPVVHVARIALPPLLVDPHARRVEPDAAEMIASRLVEALAAQSEIAYVGPDEVELWLAQRGLSLRDTDPRRLGGELAHAFGADAVLFGVVRAYLARVGGPHGATHPAAVWFELELRAPDGTRLWTGSYHEQQKSLSEDLLLLPLAWERGFEWLDAPELAEYGSRQLVSKLVAECRKWK